MRATALRHAPAPVVEVLVIAANKIVRIMAACMAGVYASSALLAMIRGKIWLSVIDAMIMVAMVVLYEMFPNRTPRRRR